MVSPIATTRAADDDLTSEAVRATGSSVSPHGTMSKTSGRWFTRGASRRGTTNVASPSTGSTSIVNRSRGMAW